MEKNLYNLESFKYVVQNRFSTVLYSIVRGRTTMLTLVKDCLQDLLDIINLDEEIHQVEKEIGYVCSDIRNATGSKTRLYESYASKTEKRKELIQERANKKSRVTRSLKKL